MKKDAVLDIEVINWEKHQSDRTASWFRVKNDLFLDHKFHSLSSSGKLLALFLWSLCSRERSSTIQLRYSLAAKMIPLRADLVQRGANELEQKQMVKISRLPDFAPREEKSREEKSREEFREVVPTTPPRVSKDPPKTTKIAKTPKAPKVATENDIELNRQIWDRYSKCFLDRYGEDPVRNAKVNSLISNLGKRLGKDAPEVVEFYVWHDSKYYLSKTHALAFCLHDAESLHLQWKKGQTISIEKIHAQDRRSNSAELFRKIEAGEL